MKRQRKTNKQKKNKKQKKITFNSKKEFGKGLFVYDVRKKV